MSGFEFDFEQKQEPKKSGFDFDFSKTSKEIIILLDVSATMKDSLEKIKEVIINIPLNIDIKIIPFSDYEYDNKEIAFNDKYDFIKPNNRNKLQEILDECIEISKNEKPGGDEPQSILDALYDSLDLFSKPIKEIYLFSNASVKYFNSNTIDNNLTHFQKIDILIGKIKDSDIMINIFIPYDKELEKLNKLKNVNLFNISDGKSILENITNLNSLDFETIFKNIKGK